MDKQMADLETFLKVWTVAGLEIKDVPEMIIQYAEETRKNACYEMSKKLYALLG